MLIYNRLALEEAFEEKRENIRMRKIVISWSGLARSLYLCCVLLVAITSTQVLASEPQAGASSSSSSPASASSSNQSSAKSGSSTGTQARQSTAASAASIIGAVGSLVPGFITNVAPLVLGLLPLALMFPYLSAAATSLLREARRR